MRRAELATLLLATLLLRAAGGSDVASVSSTDGSANAGEAGLGPQISAPHKVTLPEAIDEALSRAPDVLAAGEAVAQARADLRTASLLPNPELITGTTLQHLPGGQFSASNPGGPPQYTVDISQAVDGFLFGKRSAAIESARRAVDVATADFADAKRQRTGAVASAFFDCLEASALADLARIDVEDLRRVETLTRRRVDLGGGAPIDLDRARLAVATAAEDLRTAEAARTTAFAKLRSLLGRRDPEPEFEVAGSLDVPKPGDPPDLDGLLDRAEKVRPSVLSLHRQVEHWQAELQSQERQAFPSVSVQLGYIYQRQEPVGLQDFNEWEGSVTTSLPIFDRNQGNIAKAGSQLRQARYGLAAGRTALRAELAQALASFRAARAAVVADDPAQLAAARSVRDRMEAAYQAGGRTILELLDAEHAYRDALRLHVHAGSDYWHGLHQLNAAVGEPVIE
jgi:cobalt-zinc-cadmium efflux system outer membrane protein